MTATGAVVWFTGLSGAGKTTIGTALAHRLASAGRPALLLDGDELRRGLCSDLGFSLADRAENMRRAAHAAILVARTGAVAIVALISPEASARQRVRELVTAAQLPFLEVYASTPLAECERRDPKGLYRRARAGELADFTGIHQPYEPPARPELVLAPSEDIDVAVARIIQALPAMLARRD